MGEEGGGKFRSSSTATPTLLRRVNMQEAATHLLLRGLYFSMEFRLELPSFPPTAYSQPSIATRSWVLLEDNRTHLNLCCFVPIHLEHNESSMCCFLSVFHSFFLSSIHPNLGTSSQAVTVWLNRSPVHHRTERPSWLRQMFHKIFTLSGTNRTELKIVRRFRVWMFKWRDGS